MDDEKLAEEHCKWYMKLLRSQLLRWMEITEQLMIENFVHGIKHGRELERKKRGLQPGPPEPESGAEAGPESLFSENLENQDSQ